MTPYEFTEAMYEAFGPMAECEIVMEFYATKVDGVLIGATEDDQEKMSGLGLDTLVKCTTAKHRNYSNLKRFMVFVQTAFDMQTHFKDKEIFRKWLQMGAGYFTSTVTPKGVTIFMADSISFEKMEEEEFKSLFKKALNYYMDQLSEARSITDEEFLKLLDFC